MKDKKVFFFLLCLCSCSWTKSEIAKEAIWGGLHFGIDYRQTRETALNPDQYYEINPILGKHPSPEAVDLYFAATAILHPIITHILPREAKVFGAKIKPRAWWQDTSLILSAVCVLNNYSIGLGGEW